MFTFFNFGARFRRMNPYGIPGNLCHKRLVIHRFGVPLGEIAGVHHWIVPHRLLGWRPADHRRLGG